jgi:alpha-amylase
VEAGIEFTLLDDFHFKNAGLSDTELLGYFTTEDDSRVIRVFPGSERLRYLIPFAEPHETIDYLRHVAERHPGAILVFGDDGEKFGTWPDTKRHVYEDGWLKRFFGALEENQSWIRTATLSEALDSQAAVGRIYLPEGSYREMTEWALPIARQHQLEDLSHEMRHDARWPAIRQHIRGGNWRNFKVRYPETNEMYSRMMLVSQRLRDVAANGADLSLIENVQRELYRGQCNCSYWHGAFGGTYLPHLRNAVFNHLIAADNLMDQAFRGESPWIEAEGGDFNFDDRPEVRLANRKLVAFIAPSNGGQIYELDVRSICHNLGATLNRREEAYHRKVLAGAHQGQENCASIHDRVIFKQDGLDKRIQYDTYPRKSLTDHFYADDVSLEQVVQGVAAELGDFVQGPYEARIRRNPDRIRIQMSRGGHVGGLPIHVTKGVTLNTDGSTLELAYLLENLPASRELHFGVEFNFAGMPAGADDRFFFRGDDRLGQLGTVQALPNQTEIGLADQWLGLKVLLSSDRPTNYWTFPIETVSQSEGGFELVHQSVVVHPHWKVRGDQEGRWSVTMRLGIDTSLAESRMTVSTAAVG